MRTEAGGAVFPWLPRQPLLPAPCAFSGDRLPAAYLCPAGRGAAHHAPALVKLLAGRLREAWPEVRIVARADSGLRRSRPLAWGRRNGVDRLVGLARNARPPKRTEKGMAEMKR